MPRELWAESKWPANLRVRFHSQKLPDVSFQQQQAPATPLDPAEPYTATTLFSTHQPSTMESESDHDHRDDESVSEQEEIEETKPKSALKKERLPAPVVERPELPYDLRVE